MIETACQWVIVAFLLVNAIWTFVREVREPDERTAAAGVIAAAIVNGAMVATLYGAGAFDRIVN